MMVERLRLAREFMGTVDPLEVFGGWKAPREIYAPVFEAETRASEPDNRD